MYEGKKCIVRCNGAGVFFGTIGEFNPETGVAVLRDARRLWKWRGATECVQLSQEGVKEPENCRFTMTVPEICVTNVLEVSPCTEAAAASIEAVKVWKI